MKLKFTLQHPVKKLSLLMFMALMIAQTCFSAVNPISGFNLTSGNDMHAKKNKTKSSVSRGNPSVKVYPDVLKKSMHVVARKNNRRSVDFFVFDLEGTLMQNYKMKAKDHMKISGLKKGSYIFRVFCGDEETSSGNFEIL